MELKLRLQSDRVELKYNTDKVFVSKFAGFNRTGWN